MHAHNLFFPDPKQLIAEGFSKYVDVPCVFGPNWVYDDNASLYLRERALRVYRPRNTRVRGAKLKPSTMSTFGQALCNALEYLGERNLDVRTIEYQEHVIDGYQAEMRNGTFAVDNRKLSASTVNGRADELCNYVEWLASKGYRGPFYFPTNTNSAPAPESQNSHGHRTSRDTTVRSGRVRVDPMNLRMPTEAELDKWLNGVLVKKGETFHLMCELIIESAIRRRECVEWRVDTLPLEKDKWRVAGNYVLIDVVYGTKGETIRTILLPLRIARKIHAYRKGSRAKIIAQWINSADTTEERKFRENNPPEKLFLSPHTLKPVSYSAIYTAWKEVPYLPYPEWHPHLGRHYWVCKTLINELAKQLNKLPLNQRRDLPLDWTTANAGETLLVLVQPQLGHVDKKTCAAYTRWLRSEYMAMEFGEAYPSALES